MPSIDPSSSPQSFNSLSPQSHKVSTKYNGVEIKVEVIDDICDLNVDAIINAANPQLKPGGGICGAIYAKGGQQIFDQCQLHINSHYDDTKSVEPGHVMWTTGGDLKAKYVIHAVGPIWNRKDKVKQKEASDILRKLGAGILDTAASIQAKTIAIPAISTGIYGFPAKKAALSTVGGIKDYLNGNPHEKMHSICIAVFKNNFKAYKEALMKTFDESSPAFEKRKIHLEKNEESTPTQLNHPLFRFYRGEGPDSNGRFLDEILKWSHEQKEAQHDYIQELFPLKERSEFNLSAHVLNDSLLKEMKQDRKVIANMRKAFGAMLHFYGFEFQTDQNKIVETSKFAKRSQEWLTPGNHNFLRLTRILKSLELFGLHNESHRLFEALQNIHARYPEIVGNSFHYWQKALEDK